MATYKQMDRHTHASCNAVPLVWGSLRLVPINTADHRSLATSKLTAENHTQLIYNIWTRLSFLPPHAISLVSQARPNQLQYGSLSVCDHTQGRKKSCHSVVLKLIHTGVGWVWLVRLHCENYGVSKQFLSWKHIWKLSIEYPVKFLHGKHWIAVHISLLLWNTVF